MSSLRQRQLSKGVVSTVLAWLFAAVSLGGAALLWWLRWVDPLAPQYAQLVAFTPFGIVLAALGLGCGALLLRRGRLAASLLLTVSTALLAGHVWWQIPSFAGTTPSPGQPRIVVAAQNFEFGDPLALVALARRHDVDVLVVTDADQVRVSALDDAGLAHQFPHVQSHGSTTVWSRFPVGAPTPLVDNGRSRVVPLDVPGLGEVTLVAVHPHPPYRSDEWSSDWDQILDGVDEHLTRDPVPPVIVAGDFNATLDNLPLRHLARAGLDDAAEATNAGWTPTWPSAGHTTILGLRVPPVLALDHVMTGGGLVAARLVLDDSVGSDHAAVVATIGPDHTRAALG